MVVFASLALVLLGAILGEMAFVSDKNKTSTLFQKLVVLTCAAIAYSFVGFGLSQGNLVQGWSQMFSSSGTISGNLIQGLVISIVIGVFATNALAEQ